MRLFLTLALATVPMFAGALTLQVDDVKSNDGTLVAHITACHSPEKTTVTAFAEGVVNGKRQTIALKVVRLSEHLSGRGAFAVAHDWPREGAWVVKLIATNPEYKNYSTAIVVPIREDGAIRAAAKVFYHVPSTEEVDSVLKQTTLE